MTNSEIFTAAHKLTKETIQKGDSYSATFGLCLSFIYAGKNDEMETYETFKSSAEKCKVEAFKNQYDEITVLVVINNREFSLVYYADETSEERTADFLSEYGTNPDSEKAITLIDTFLLVTY